MFKFLQAFAFALIFSVGPTVAVAQDDHPAQQLVVETVTSMLELYKNEGERLKTDSEYLQSKVDELIVPNLDFESMTRLAVGKFWRRADEQQRVALVEEFTKLLIGTYTNALTQYGGEQGGESVTFEPFRPERRDDRAIVRSNFKQRTSTDVDVFYKLANREGNGWKIYDIVADDNSLVILYKSGFASEIEKGGIDGLIKLMQERNS